MVIKHSYWWDQSIPYFKHTDAIPSQADVVIIGAGFTGLITAFAVRHHSPKSKIIILDKAPFAGYKSSGRQIGAAFACSYLLPSLQNAVIGDNFTDAFKTSLNNNKNLISLLRTLDIKYDNTGYITVTSDENDIKLFKQSEDVMNEMGKITKIFDNNEIRNISYISNIKASYYNDNAVIFNPFELTNRLAAQLSNDKNVSIYFNSGVKNINRKGKFPVIQLDNDHLVKAKLIIHCNAFTWRDLLPDVTVNGKRHHLLATCSASNLHSILSTLPIVNYNNSSGFKFVFHNGCIICETDLSSKQPTEDDSLLDDDIINSMSERLTTLMPYTSDLTIDYCWSYINHTLPNMIPLSVKITEKEYVNSMYGDNEYAYAVSLSNGLISSIFGKK